MLVHGEMEALDAGALQELAQHEHVAERAVARLHQHAVAQHGIAQGPVARHDFPSPRHRHRHWPPGRRPGWHRRPGWRPPGPSDAGRCARRASRRPPSQKRAYLREHFLAGSGCPARADSRLPSNGSKRGSWFTSGSRMKREALSTLQREVISTVRRWTLARPVQWFILKILQKRTVPGGGGRWERRSALRWHFLAPVADHVQPPSEVRSIRGRFLLALPTGSRPPRTHRGRQPNSGGAIRNFVARLISS